MQNEVKLSKTSIWILFITEIFFSKLIANNKLGNGATFADIISLEIFRGNGMMKLSVIASI
jgi:hypothetical protein